jgi:tRNA (guanine-N7-)-methyltransferase
VRKRRRLPAEALASYAWELPEEWRGRPDRPPREPTPIDWRELFGNENPVEIEVGFGKGLFLVTAASSHPERNFFGVEIVRKYQLCAATRIAVRGLSNVKTCCGDAKLVMRHFIVPGSVAAVHVYFPDPWWKARHKKRLLFTPEFADLVDRVLRPGGNLHFVSDVQEYFGMVTGLVAEVPAFRMLPPPEAGDPKHDMDYLTNFERKFRKEGRPIYRSRYEKVG